jgi:hypothetical protein
MKDVRTEIERREIEQFGSRGNTSDLQSGGTQFEFQSEN